MSAGALEHAFRRGFWWAALACAAGCGERDRLTFPTADPGDGSGPVTEISQPLESDSSVFDGDLLEIQGRTYDPDGVDTVYFQVDGINQAFAPLQGEGADTVNFALQISTLNLTGTTVDFRAYGVDLLGDQGAPDGRQIRIE
jgi:hypothetical protein